jgi:glycosyltransferase involved in cell wall biosynthesis
MFHIQLSAGGSFVRKSIALAIIKGLGGTAFVHIHGSNFDSFANSSWLSQRLVRFVLSKADARAVLAPAWRGRLERVLNPDETLVVPNPAVVAATTHSTRRIPGSVIFLGEIGARKGVPDLLAAAHILQEREVPFTLTVAGEGDAAHAQELQSRLPRPDSIEVRGWVPPEEAHRLLQSSVIFCLPSYAEGLPMAVLEAMISGCAVVTTPVGGIPDLLTDGVDALLVRPGEPSKLADALERLLLDDKLRTRIGAAGRGTAFANNGLPHVTDSLAEAYTILGHPPAPPPQGGSHLEGDES